MIRRRGGENKAKESKTLNEYERKTERNHPQDRGIYTMSPLTLLTKNGIGEYGEHTPHVSGEQGGESRRIHSTSPTGGEGNTNVTGIGLGTVFEISRA